MIRTVTIIDTQAASIKNVRDNRKKGSTYTGQIIKLAAGRLAIRVDCKGKPIKYGCVDGVSMDAAWELVLALGFRIYDRDGNLLPEHDSELDSVIRPTSDYLVHRQA